MLTTITLLSSLLAIEIFDSIKLFLILSILLLSPAEIPLSSIFLNLLSVIKTFDPEKSAASPFILKYSVSDITPVEKSESKASDKQFINWEND